MALGCRFGDAEDCGSFRNAEPNEVPQFDKFRLERIDLSETIESLVYLKEPVRVDVDGDGIIRQLHEFFVASSTQGLFSTGGLDEDASHGFGRSGEEVGAIGPLRLCIPAQPQPRFMDEGGRLEGVVRLFGAHALASQGAQLRIDLFEEPS